VHAASAPASACRCGGADLGEFAGGGPRAGWRAGPQLQAQGQVPVLDHCVRKLDRERSRSTVPEVGRVAKYPLSFPDDCSIDVSQWRTPRH
jgi:hypothetical protein